MSVVMPFSFAFALGLGAYLRQAALSLHRAPPAFSEALSSYYQANGLPHPAHVLIYIDSLSNLDTSKFQKLVGRISGAHIAFSDPELSQIKACLYTFGTVLDRKVVESYSEQNRIRMSLSDGEELVRKKLGSHVDKIERIEHLNQSAGIILKPLHELAGAHWPDSY